MINGLTLNQLAAECHSNNAKWWHDLETGERLDRNKGELIMLVISEFAEAMEGERKDLMDEKIPHRKAAEVELVDGVIRLADFGGAFGYDLDGAQDLGSLDLPENKGDALLQICKAASTVEVLCSLDSAPTFVADQIVRTLKLIDVYATRWGYDLSGAYQEKSAFNKVRKDHTAEARKATGGKKW